MSKVTIIAEAGVNHNGSIENAFRLIDAAVTAGVDFVKFQTFKAEKLVSKTAAKAAYQEKNTGSTETQLSMLKKLELSAEQHETIIEYCIKKGINFLSTPFDEESILLLKGKGIKIGKIPSGEITNLPYLNAMAKAFPEIILSTGMSDMQEIREALAILLDAGVNKEKITILHCNTEYPTPMEDVNLKAMNHIGDELGVAIGYSDHTLGIEVPIAAVALGATVIEKHFTLDRNMDGPDHKASLEPNELKEMVLAIRNIEKAISGTGSKEPSPSELKNKVIARKSIHLYRDLSASHQLTADDLVMKRPGTGISPMQLEKIIGRELKQDLKTDHLLSPEDLV